MPELPAVANGSYTSDMPASSSVKAPSTILTALETRAALEYSTWPLLRPMLSQLRSGDGHPVLILPGFTASDQSTARLRALLRRLGYRTYGWKLGTNLGPTPHIVSGLADRFADIVDREGRPVSIIGWSLGGIYARSLARNNHDVVRQVITMGSPIRMTPNDSSAASGMWDALSPLFDPDTLAAMADPDWSMMPVPTTSIYTRTDGIVHWRTCLETRSLTSENIEVYGSHSGLAFNPSVAIAVADRLAQKTGRWKRFRPPIWAAAAFPRPANWRPRTSKTDQQSEPATIPG